MFQAPPPTQYDLKFTIFGFPVRVHPLFWLITLLLGYTPNVTRVVTWIVVVFVSILVHELGHTFAMRRFGISSHIVLHTMGGLAIPDSYGYGRRGSLGYGEQIFISLAGPLAGFLLAAVTIGVVMATGGTVNLVGFLPQARVPYGGQVAAIAINMLLWVNIFWGLLNLLPIFPLDGGQISRHIFSAIDPVDGFRNALWLSVITGAVAAVAGYFYFGSIYMALLFGLLAFQSYQIVNGGR